VLAAVRPTTQAAGSVVRRWTTDVVPPRERLDFYGATLTSALVMPTRMLVESPKGADFHSSMAVADLGSIWIVRQHGSAHRSYRRLQDAKRNSARLFSIVVSLKTRWNINHRDPLRLDAGEGIMIDSELSNEMMFSSEYEVSHLRFSEPWLRTWLPSAGTMVGRRIASDRGWGGALTTFIAQLSPEIVDAPPLPLHLIADHVGALLALAASEFETPIRRTSAADRDLRLRVEDLVTQRCTESALTAADLAATLAISTRTLHRALARFGQTFGELLIAARSATAMRMLESPLYRRVTSAEIGRRAGFPDASHFARTIRARFGRSPTEIRLSRAIKLE